MRKLLVGLVAGIVLASAGMALASIPDSSGVIQGCYKTADGKLRVIDSATQTCASGETALSWNQQGPEGPTGAIGPTGPAGPSSFTMIHRGGSVSMTVPAHNGGSGFWSTSKSCQAGEVATGGGYYIQTSPYQGSVLNAQALADVTVVGSHADPSGGQTWEVDVTNTSDYDVIVVVYVDCLVGGS